MSKKRHCNTSTKKRQTHQSPRKPKVYLTLNTGYKIATKATAKRLEAVLLIKLAISKDDISVKTSVQKILPGLAVFLDFGTVHFL